MTKTYFLTAICSLLSLTACHDGEGETVESTYMLPIEQVPDYKYSRSGLSTVDQWECAMNQKAATYIYESFLQKAYLHDDDDMQRLKEAFEEGQNAAHLSQQVAETVPEATRQLILQDFQQLFDDTRALGQHTYQPAAEATPGYIGYSAGDNSRSFANADGIIPAEVFNGMITGTIYLNKIMNKHLTTANFDNENLRNAHRDLQIGPGNSYTELEHHWDLAYGYFNNMKAITQSEGIALLKNRERKLYEAFAWGRYALGHYDYKLLKEKMDFIRKDLSQIVAARAMYLLIGPNTMANIESKNPQNAFFFISQAYGLVYALQFCCDMNGQPAYSYEEIKSLLQLFKDDKGLWNIERLKADSTTKGSLQYIVMAIGNKFGITLDQLIR
ncbi:DUF4856 domain-containing protein [Prevotella sp.]|uniref:DUF4856 domain-containing protein n=1 Tax=Prevotella sp. TaxID=59823 RepID=UPI002F9261CC